MALLVCFFDLFCLVHSKFVKEAPRLKRNAIYFRKQSQYYHRRTKHPEVRIYCEYHQNQKMVISSSGLLKVGGILVRFNRAAQTLVYKSVVKYFRPESQSNVATVLPGPSCLAFRIAATTLAPEEVPTKSAS